MKTWITLVLLAATAIVTAAGCGDSKGGTSGSSGSAGAGGAPDCSMEFPTPTACQSCAADKCCSEFSDCKGDADCTTCLSDPNADQTKCDANAQVKALNTCLTTTCLDACSPKCARYCCADTDCGTGKCVVGDFVDFPTLGLCLDSMQAAACDAPAMSMSMGACFTVDMTNVCNPVTNEGCNAAMGEACDLDGGAGKFGCFPMGNTQDICKVCSNNNGPFCKATFHCVL